MFQCPFYHGVIILYAETLGLQNIPKLYEQTGLLLHESGSEPSEP